MLTPAARREAVAYLRQAFEMSEPRACRLIDSDRACATKACGRMTGCCASA